MHMYARVCICFTWRSKSASFCFSNSHFLPISYHTDELDELQSHRHHNSFTEVVYGTNHLVVTSKQGFHQSGLVFWAEYWSCWAEKGHKRNAQRGQRSAEWVTFAGVRLEMLSAAARVAQFGVWLILSTNCGSYNNKCIFVFWLRCTSACAAIPSWRTCSRKCFNTGTEIAELWFMYQTWLQCILVQPETL